jgi:predicted metal-dependent HD superfamily phosphohydrolase
MQTASIEPQWRDFWIRAGAVGDPTPVYQDLATRYTEPHRAYHTLAHIAHCLQELQPARFLADEPVAVELALWYHDAIYDPRARDNEAQSALLAVEIARHAGLGDQIGQAAADFICATVHRQLPLGTDAQLVVDVDLAILGRPEAAFDAYERAVRQEYAWVPDDAFAAGRRRILEGLLARPVLYGTDWFRTRYEAAARRNLARSIRHLGDPAAGS